MGRAYQTATRKGGRHSVHYNNYDLRTVKTKTCLYLDYVGRCLFRHAHTLVLPCIAKPPRGARW